MPTDQEQPATDAPEAQFGNMLDCEIQPSPLAHPLSDYHYAGVAGTPLHYTWTDKPHRLLYDLIAAVRYYAQPAPAPAEDMAVYDAIAANYKPAPAPECDSPKLCAVNGACAGQYGTKKQCDTAQPAPAPAASGEPVAQYSDIVSDGGFDPRNASPQPAPARALGWVPVAERLPQSGVTVLACYRNSAGKLRRIRAEWIAAQTQESGGESIIGVYDEATDTYYDPEGWYEKIDNWDDGFSAIGVHQGEVTHWMPLPAAPDTQKEAP